MSDPDGTAAVDIQDGTMTRASTTGVPSENEDGSLATGRILVRRKNRDGATWGEAYEVKARVGGGPMLRVHSCYRLLPQSKEETGAESERWAGIGHVAVGMARQGYDLQLKRYDEGGWRATFYTTGIEHSPTSASGSAWERTPWRATQRGRNV